MRYFRRDETAQWAALTWRWDGSKMEVTSQPKSGRWIFSSWDSPEELLSSNRDVKEVTKP